MTGDNAPPPGGVAPLRVIGSTIACTFSSQTVYILTVSSSRCAAAHTSRLAPAACARCRRRVCLSPTATYQLIKRERSDRKWLSATTSRSLAPSTTRAVWVPSTGSLATGTAPPSSVTRRPSGSSSTRALLSSGPAWPSCSPRSTACSGWFAAHCGTGRSASRLLSVSPFIGPSRSGRLRAPSGGRTASFRLSGRSSPPPTGSFRPSGPFRLRRTPQLVG